MRRDKAFSFGDLKWMTNGLEEELEPRDVIDTLLVSGFLTFSDHEDIFRATSRLERVRLLLDIVRRCGDIQFHLFIGALSKKCLKLIRKLKKEYQRQKQGMSKLILFLNTKSLLSKRFGAHIPAISQTVVNYMIQCGAIVVVLCVVCD